ncbi:MAG: hypothetical protein QNJ74_22880 [Trichodesmium sp. MO_231.B1]|nr:hypothetical protein [Trichodesmium sp. MO_231.B1]
MLLNIQRIPCKCGTVILLVVEYRKMQAYSIDLREKIVKAYEQCNTYYPESSSPI